MNEHSQAQIDNANEMSASKLLHSSIPSNAAAILSLLINDPNLDIPAAMTRNASSVMFTPEVGGKPFIESQVVPRAIHLDKWKNRETYRNILSNMYKTKDDRYFHLHGSLNATPTLQMLGLPEHRLDLQGIEHVEAIKDIYRSVVAEKDSVSLESETNERWLQPGATCRTIEEYAITPHGKLNIEEPLYSISKCQDQLPSTPWPQSVTTDQPLAGIKVLDLTKVIAGPTVTRVLALLGADVLRISTDTQPDALPFIADSQLGKRDASINLKTSDGKRQLDELLKEADVVVSSYRPGVFDRLGLGRAWAHEHSRRLKRSVL